MDVLVTDGDYKNSLAIVRSLGRKKIRVTVLANSAVDLAACSRYCSAAEILPNPGTGGFVEHICRILRKKSFDLIIPVGYMATLSFAQNKDKLTPHAKLEVADYADVLKAADKRYISELATSVGVPVPRTSYPASTADVAKCASKFNYPLVIKPPIESAGVTVHYVNDQRHLVAGYQDFCESSCNPNGTVPMLQEFVPGYGCGFFALYQGGHCKRVFMHRRIRENPPSGGASTCAESFYDAKLKDYGIRLLNALRWHGVAMVEFRYDLRDRDYKLLEINPKFWGSLDLAVAAGVDFPYDLCRIARGEHLEYSEEYERNLRYHWPISGEIQHLWHHPSSFGSMLIDFLNPKVQSNLWLSDPRPNLREGFALARSLYQRIFKG